MGFVKDAATALVSPAASLLSKKKKPAAPPLRPPTMISTTPYERPMSLIGQRRG